MVQYNVFVSQRGLAEWLQANNSDTIRTTRMHRNTNLAQKQSQTNANMTDITKEQKSEETNEQTKQHANLRTYKQTNAKKNNKIESLAI